MAAYPNTTGATTFESDDVDYDVAKLTAAQHAALQNFKNGNPGAIGFSATKEYQLAVKVSGVKITEVYSVSEWTVSASDQVSKSQLDAIEKNDKLLGQSFALNDNNEIDLDSFELVGVDSLSDIDVDDVVYVYTNGTITKIEVSDLVVSGEITRLKDGKYTINGKAYGVYTGAGNKSVSLSVGDESIHTLDGWKDYDYKSRQLIDWYYRIQECHTGEGLNNKDAQVKLFLADGTNKTFVVDEDAYETAVANLIGTNGVWGDTTVAADVGSGSAANLVGTAVKYEINKDGNISALELIAWQGGGMVATDVKLTDKGYYNGFKVASDALIISYTDADGALPYTTKAGDYSVLQLSNLLDTLLVDAYYTLNSSNQLDFLYISSSTSSTDDVFAVVVGVEKNSSDAGYGVDMLIDGEEVYKDSKNYFDGASAMIPMANTKLFISNL